MCVCDSDSNVLRAEEVSESWYDYNVAFSTVTRLCEDETPATSPDVGVGLSTTASGATTGLRWALAEVQIHSCCIMNVCLLVYVPFLL